MSDDHSKIDSLLKLFGLSGYYQKYEIKSKTKFTCRNPRCQSNES